MMRMIAKTTLFTISIARSARAEIPHASDGKTRQDGHQENLRNFAASQSVNKGARDKRQQERDDARFLGAADKSGGRFWIERGGIDVEPRAGVKNHGNDDADDEREGRDHFEIDEGLYADRADFLEVGHRGDALDDHAEDYRRDHHANQRDEGVS